MLVLGYKAVRPSELLRFKNVGETAYFELMTWGLQSTQNSVWHMVDVD